MNKALAILLSIALYAPYAAKILAYTQCIIVATINNAPNCNCTITDDNSTKNKPIDNDKQKQISTSVDWKFIVTNKHQFSCLNFSNTIKYTAYKCPYNAVMLINTVFHPPAC